MLGLRIGLLALLLAPVWAQDSLESIWVVRQEGQVVVAWRAVEGAIGYQVYVEVEVSVGMTDEGLVDLEEPTAVFVPWGFVEQGEGEIIQAGVALFFLRSYCCVCCVSDRWGAGAIRKKPTCGFLHRLTLTTMAAST